MIWLIVQKCEDRLKNAFYIYSGAQMKVYEYCFMKQNCQIQMDIEQSKSVDMPLGLWGINITQRQFQMRCTTVF